MKTFDISNYVFEPGILNRKNVIWVKFSYNKILKEQLLEQFPFAKWNVKNSCWYLIDRAVIREQVNLTPLCYSGKAILPHVHPVNQPELRRLIEELKLRAYSFNTIKTYTLEFAQLLYLLKKKPVKQLLPTQIRSYILYCISTLKLSEYQIQSRLNALKFYFEKVLKREPFFTEIPRPKKKMTLPKVLSKEEVKEIFSVIENPKHLLIMNLCYGMGLKVSEVVNLKISDIDSNRMLVLIESAKGKKDRYVPLPEAILREIHQYYLKYKPKKYLFEGQYGGQYSRRSVQSIFKSAIKKAGVQKNIGIQGLRHSYATHLLEMGTDMSIIQKLLGHQNIKTTEIYAQITCKEIAKVKSPPDNMILP